MGEWKKQSCDMEIVTTVTIPVPCVLTHTGPFPFTSCAQPGKAGGRGLWVSDLVASLVLTPFPWAVLPGEI